jgi:hypothetical protein
MLDARSQKEKETPGPTVVVMRVSIANKVCTVVLCVRVERKEKDRDPLL